jgi:hypothetical protein
MLNPEQIGRIADAVAAIRPEWPVGQVADYLEANHAHRSYATLAAAAIYVAAEPKARDLTALEIAGIWWITPAPRPATTVPVEHKLGPKRDEAWWDKFHAAEAQRRIAFGYPRPEEEEAEPEA